MESEVVWMQTSGSSIFTSAAICTNGIFSFQSTIEKAFSEKYTSVCVCQYLTYILHAMRLQIYFKKPMSLAKLNNIICQFSYKDQSTYIEMRLKIEVEIQHYHLSF